MNLPPYLVKAARAIYWAIPTRHERNLGFAATLGAGRDVHLAPGPLAISSAAAHRVAVVNASFSRRPARRASARLIRKPLARIEFLFTDREYELYPTVTTREGFIGKDHNTLLER
jgi:hypothetical protein